MKRPGTTGQAALYYARRRRQANIVFQSLTAWRAGLGVTSGQFVSSGGTAWQCTHTGTTGSVAPVLGGATGGTGGTRGDINDGNITWVPVDIMSLRSYLYSGAPTP